MKEDNLMTMEQEKELATIKEEITIGFKNLQLFRSEFLMRNSVLAMQATVDGQYWQAILERNVHFWELIRLGYDYKEKLAEIELKEAQKAQKDNEYNKLKNDNNKDNKFAADIAKAEANKIQIQIDREKTFIIHGKKEAEQRFREIKTWTKIINELKPQLKYSLSDPEEYQAEEWSRLYARKFDILQKVQQNGSDSSGIDAIINILTVGNKIFQDEKVLELCEQDSANKILI